MQQYLRTQFSRPRPRKLTSTRLGTDTARLNMNGLKPRTVTLTDTTARRQQSALYATIQPKATRSPRRSKGFGTTRRSRPACKKAPADMKRRLSMKYSQSRSDTILYLLFRTSLLNMQQMRPPARSRAISPIGPATVAASTSLMMLARMRSRITAGSPRPPVTTGASWPTHGSTTTPWCWQRRSAKKTAAMS